MTEQQQLITETNTRRRDRQSQDWSECLSDILCCYLMLDCMGYDNDHGCNCEGCDMDCDCGDMDCGGCDIDC